MEEADYEVVETSCDPAGFPRTPQNSFANLPSLPAGQLDDGFEVISQRAEEPTSLLNVDNTVAEEEESPIASLKSGVEALLTDLSASAGPEQGEESAMTTTTSSSSVVKEETSTTTTNDVVEEVQSIGEVQDIKEETKTEET